MSKPAPSKTSSNPETTGRDHTGTNSNQPPRAHRNDTPEAKAQHEATPKTHPTHGSEGARRKDDKQRGQPD